MRHAKNTAPELSDMRDANPDSGAVCYFLPNHYSDRCPVEFGSIH